VQVPGRAREVLLVRERHQIPQLAHFHHAYLSESDRTGL
jgi:hypothetical protein